MADARRVLVVEDEPSENEFLALTARGLGFAVDCAFDGPSALEAAAKARPDLVLLDALLPKLDGFAVLTALRQAHPNLPVVMMSGIYKKRSYEADAMRLGACAYLVKPLNVVAIWELLERHLGKVDAGLPSDFPGISFQRRPLPAVVADLHAASKTGLLFVRGSGGAAILFFEDGSLVFARCTDPATRLDRMLAASGRIPPESLPRVAELAAASRGARLGDLLVQDGLATQEIVSAALAEQQGIHLTRPFTWTEGACYFFPSDAPRRESFKMSVDVPSLVFWGCRNLPIDDNLINWIPPTDRMPRLTQPVGEIAPRIGLSSAEAQFADLVDGTRSIGKLRAIARMLQVDGERVLAGLHALQYLDTPPAETARAASGMSGAAVPAAGDITRYAPPMLFVTMALARRTGLVQFESTDPAGQSRMVWFEHGAIAFASSNDPQDRLGQVLLREKLLSREQLQQALAAAQERPGAALGRVLVDLGLLGPDDLHRALVLQVQRVVCGLLGWRNGGFQFQERALPVKEIVPLGLDTRQILMDAFRNCDFADLVGHLPPPATRLRRTAACHELASDLPLTAVEDRILLEVDGESSVGDLAAAAAEGREATLRSIHALMSVGLLEGFVGRPTATATTVTTVTTAAPPPQPPAEWASAQDLAADPAANEDPSFASLVAAGEDDAAVGWASDRGSPDLPLDGGLEPLGEPAATATAVADPAPKLAIPVLPAHLVELGRFFELLSAWLEANPGTVAEGVLAALPADLRALFRL